MTALELKDAQIAELVATVRRLETELGVARRTAQHLAELLNRPAPLEMVVRP